MEYDLFQGLFDKSLTLGALALAVWFLVKVLRELFARLEASQMRRIEGLEAGHKTLEIRAEICEKDRARLNGLMHDFLSARCIATTSKCNDRAAAEMRKIVNENQPFENKD